MEDNKKFQSTIKTSKELFWKYGLKRVSVEEICKEAKVSKMTFYKFFPNKIELAKYIYKSVMEESINKFEGIIHSKMAFENKIEQLFLLKFENTEHISREFILDIYKNNDSELTNITEEYTAIIIKMLTDFFYKEQENGNIRENIKIEFIFYLINKIQLTILDPQLHNLYDNTQDMIMDIMRFFMNGIIKK